MRTSSLIFSQHFFLHLVQSFKCLTLFAGTCFFRDDKYASPLFLLFFRTTFAHLDGSRFLFLDFFTCFSSMLTSKPLSWVSSVIVFCVSFLLEVKSCWTFCETKDVLASARVFSETLTYCFAFCFSCSILRLTSSSSLLKKLK